jgi:hypothetical protein
MRIDSAHPPRQPFFRSARRRATPHQIRLRGPWHWQAAPSKGTKSSTRAEGDDRVPESAEPGNPFTFTAPDGLRPILAVESITHLRVTRTFHRPTGLDSGSRVDLVIEPVSAPCTVHLNGVALGSIESGAGRFSIAQHLQPANQLQLDLDLARAGQQESSPPRIDVRLEIT